MRHAYVIDKIVREIITVPPRFVLGEMYPAEFVARCYACEQTVSPGWVYDGVSFAPQEAPIITLEEANTQKYQEIIAGANAMDAAIKARYSQPEIASFEVQRQGAEAILAASDVQGSPDSPVGLVRGLAAAEGVEATVFAARIMYNVAQASAATALILFQQRAYEAALKRAASTDEVAAIIVNYTLG